MVIIQDSGLGFHETTSEMPLEPPGSPAAPGRGRGCNPSCGLLACSCPSQGPGWRPRQAWALSELRPRTIARTGTASLPATGTGRQVYKYAPRRPLSFPLGPAFLWPRGQESIWLHGATHGGQSCPRAERGTAGTAVGSVPWWWLPSRPRSVWDHHGPVPPSSLKVPRAVALKSSSGVLKAHRFPLSAKVSPRSSRS